MAVFHFKIFMLFISVSLDYSYPQKCYFAPLFYSWCSSSATFSVIFPEHPIVNALSTSTASAPSLSLLHLSHSLSTYYWHYVAHICAYLFIRTRNFPVFVYLLYFQPKYTLQRLAISYSLVEFFVAREIERKRN